MRTENAEPATKDPELEPWRHLGEMVIAARKSLGWRTRPDFVRATGLSKRLLLDVENGTRSTVTPKTLMRVEQTLGWPEGAISQILTDPDYVPQTNSRPASLDVFQPPKFSRDPVRVSVENIEELATTLSALSAEAESSNAELRLKQSAVRICLPYIERLAEDNCSPGISVHAAIRPIVDEFVRVAKHYSPSEPGVDYVCWLAGENESASPALVERYMERFQRGRRSEVDRSRD
ncbi:Uncharacterised protein (plasmid) [Tsukamurella tyrosinosolvens]|uniref:Helix-turn-helix domain-containing protein n=1 Tax=Tsukamurella tyrosinosolvens TaxID=57704 RepID=A0A1H4VJE9_TSUTY|nr:helix-turn-helix domain-containing protein [Tsukamurella tyrosinosolvens]KXO90960.1 hypothetical protein AXK58_21240 [Tsukamurella tyrosinosolvens]SEC81055.1 hypothetical protein SAMN04489793_3246 [Tsukamurella tyrosinosolvens]VEH90481.1 Uncharacterised protein [Tsukamurella tyrosinosolvens]